MSLVVSVRTPNGIVIAGDTLTSVTRTQNTTAQGQPPTSTASSFPASTSTTKVFSFLGSLGVGVTGHPYVGGHSVESVIRQAGKELAGSPIKSVEKATRKLGARVRQQITNATDKVSLVVCGYDGHEARTVTAAVTQKQVRLPTNGASAAGPGVSVTGEGYVVQALWKLASDRKVSVGSTFFSLRDAIEHAKFLIRITEGYQRFFLEPQTVGGMIDVGLIDQLEGFKWIQRASHIVPEK